ncbi:MAG: hypothetical protein AAF623_18345 [Planctomycetota bacterium]
MLSFRLFGVAIAAGFTSWVLFDTADYQMSQGEMERIWGGQCYSEGTFACPVPPTTKCRDFRCTNIATEEHPQHICRDVDRVPVSPLIGFSSCEQADDGEAENISDAGLKWCWKWGLCAASCTELSDGWHYCNEGGQGGEVDCNEGGCYMAYSCQDSSDGECPPDPPGGGNGGPGGGGLLDPN